MVAYMVRFCAVEGRQITGDHKFFLSSDVNNFKQVWSFIDVFAAAFSIFAKRLAAPIKIYVETEQLEEEIECSTAQSVCMYC